MFKSVLPKLKAPWSCTFCRDKKWIIGTNDPQDNGFGITKLQPCPCCNPTPTKAPNAPHDR